MANAEHLLVPVRAQALVVDDIVIAKRGTLKIGPQNYVTNDGKWSPVAQDYRLLVNSLTAPGPRPFYGASRDYDGTPASQLLFSSRSDALPEEKDRGVYLHWVLPSGLRHSYETGSLDFPALPDQWLITRFCRQGSGSNAKLQTKAWFVDSGLVLDTDDPTNLLFASDDKYEARSVGKVVALDEFDPADFRGERTTITATGNQQTSSPTFTAYVAENRNILSWHDDLGDLRAPLNTGKIPKDTVLSYQVLGWYHNEKNEPLTALRVKLAEAKPTDPPSAAKIIELLGWSIASSSPLPDDLLKRRCLFHGMVSYINYWNSGTYQGPILGYPDAPAVEGVMDTTKPSFKVGVGNSAEDALVSLVSGEYSEEEKPNLWKALEAVLYRQTESLIGGWNTAPRDHAVHQNWFSALDAGKIWSIRPRARQESMFPTDPDATAEQAATKPTSEQLTKLKQLNDAQAEADAFGRELGALQQDLYARWWKLAERSRREPRAGLIEESNHCLALSGRLSTLRTRRERSLGSLPTLRKELEDMLPKEKLELYADAAPRFYTPADPVIIVKNCGLPTKHQFPRPLSCRLPDQIVTAAEVEVAKQAKPFSNVAGVSEIADAASKHFKSRSENLANLLKDLLNEASLVEQAVSDLADRTLPSGKKFNSARDWREWTEKLVKVMSWDGKPKSLLPDRIQFGKPGALDVAPHRLTELWVRQPWSPLFLDWQITWFPTTKSDKDFGPVWQMGEHDFQQLDKKPPPKDGFTVQGRTLLSPIDGRIFDKPIEMLRELLKGNPKGEESSADFPEAVAEILSRYEEVWDETLGELASAGMMGQALTGLHQALLRRDSTLPHVMPDPARPWIEKEKFQNIETEAGRLLGIPGESPLVGERLAPPAPATTEMPFTMLRGGALRIDELWLVDDFGQWVDLLGATPSRTSSGQVLHPRVRWHNSPNIIAMPPRVVQPARLNFRFTPADKGSSESGSDPALSPVCGWMFYNPLDQVLVLCDREGQLAGELVITKEQSGYRINWERGAGGVAIDEIHNSSLEGFARSLITALPPNPATPNPRILDLLNLIDSVLARIRPAAARRDAALFGRPLALVSATLGLELFGKAWTDPRQKPAEASPQSTGDAALDALQVRVNLGCLRNTEDGLIGYFKDDDYSRIVPTQLPEKIKPAGYIANPKDDAVRVGFGEPKPLILLMDPWGSVQAAAGLVPAKTITLAQAELDRTLAQMEASFRVGPVLLQAGRLALPTPAGDKGRWNFCGPLTDNAAAVVVPSDPRYFSDQPVVATEGRLLLLTEDE